MTLRQFLDAAYALLVEEYQRLGIGLMDAIDKTVQWRAGGDQEPPPPPSSEEVALQNDAALAQLQTLMAGVKPR